MGGVGVMLHNRRRNKIAGSFGKTNAVIEELQSTNKAFVDFEVSLFQQKSIFFSYNLLETAEH